MSRVMSMNTTVLILLFVFQVCFIVRHYDMRFLVYYVIQETEMQPSKEYVVPNIVHFIRFGNSTLTFMDAVCMLAALKNQKPSELLVHSDQKDFNGGKYWNIVVDHPLARGIVQVKYLPQPDTIYGKRFSKQWGLYHKSDTERLRILMKYGGIYVDNDLYIVSSLNKFRLYEMTLGWEDGGGISDQVIIAAANARFLRVWLESYKDYRAESWFYNGGNLPTQLLEARPYLVNSVKHGLAEWRAVPHLIYYEKSETWRTHYAIHLLLRHQKNILPQNHSATAPYPVVFNETNIMNYDVTIKDMALAVYPIKRERYKRKSNTKKNRNTARPQKKNQVSKANDQSMEKLRS